jgi:hypothetical protein
VVISPVAVVVDASVVVVPVAVFVDVVVVVVWAKAVPSPNAQTTANIFSNLVCFIVFLCFG